MKRDMSFTSQILLEMKSNEFWTSPWQQLRLINHYSAQIFMRPDFTNPGLNLHLTRQAEFDNRRSLVWIRRENYSVPSVSSLPWAPVFCPDSLCSWFAAPAWRDSPAEPRTRRGKDEEGKISFRKRSAVIYLSSPAQRQKKIQRIKRKHYSGKQQPPLHHRTLKRIFQTLDAFPPKLPREEKNTPNFPLKK